MNWDPIGAIGEVIGAAGTLIGLDFMDNVRTRSEIESRKGGRA